jgi:hypothetical protein
MTNRVKIPTFFNENKFDLRAFIFKITMQNNHADVLDHHWFVTLSPDFGLL